MTAPTWYTNIEFDASAPYTSGGNGFFVESVVDAGATPMLGAPSRVTVSGSLSQAGATAYKVYDWNGNLVSSGPISGTTWRAQTPSAGWKRGIYRFTITGPNTDPTYGNCYGTSSFLVCRYTSWLAALNPQKATGGEQSSVPVHAFIGLSPQRIQIVDATSGGTDNWDVSGITGFDYYKDSPKSALLQAQQWAALAPNDPSKTWNVWLQFPNRTWDNLAVSGSSGTTTFLTAYCKDGTIDGGTVFVAAGAGTSSGSMIQVYSPNSSTLVETYDNLPDAATAASTINAASGYIMVFAGSGTADTLAPLAIGNAYRNGVLATSQHLYPAGVTHYDGPYNEPYGSAKPNAELVHQMQLFAGAIHAGNASAKAIGPSFVDADANHWQTWFDLGGNQWCDEFATHWYNTWGGPMNLGQVWLQETVFDKFFDILAGNNAATVPVWDTEGMQTGWIGNPYQFCDVNGVFLQHRYGIRSSYWYDESHGFGYADWLLNANGTPNAQVPLFRVVAEETYGMTFDRPVDFGSVQANQLFFGNVYRDATTGAQTLAMFHGGVGGSGDVTVTLQLSGTVPSQLTVVDPWGNESSVAVAAGQATVSVQGRASYVRIPAGAGFYVYSVLDWGATPASSISQYARATVGGSPAIRVLDGDRTTTNKSSAALPDVVDVHFNSSVNVDHVIVCATVNSTPLRDFDVETSTDGGTTWTTRVTVTDPADLVIDNCEGPTSYGSNWQTTQDGFPNSHTIQSVPLGATYLVNAVRLNVRSDGVDIAEIIVPSASAPTAFTDGYQTLTNTTAGLVGYWRLDEASGTAAVSQISSPADDGTYSSPVVVTPGPYAGCLRGHSFTGGTNCALPTLTVSDQFTIALWVSWDIHGGANILTYGFGEWLTYNGGIVEFGANNTMVVSNTVAVTDLAFHHVVVTKNGATARMYVDGSDDTTVGTNVTVTTLPNTIGGGNISVAELAFYNVALSASQVSDLYQSCPIPVGVPAADTTWHVPAPQVKGTAKAGCQLQATTGHWTNLPTGYTYQWQASTDVGATWANLAGATRSDYPVQATDSGHQIRCQVTASNLFGAGTAQNSGAVTVG